MICDNCGKRGAKVRKVTQSFGRGRAAFLIEDVPVVTCTRCGESYVTAQTLREIERIRAHRRRLTERRLVPVARFGGAA
ncbi:MAG: type II toxin-antitoxin system MqsA family antitoxin [Candidatus Rokubacteria bacterium]|nr:type II toxin-antitoxin system MqsA family antitoxin [Candidatus Rokubacteria bacterium]